VLNWAPPCRACWFCEHGEPYLCAHAEDARNHTYASLSSGEPVYPGLGTAAFAAATVVPAQACIPVPADLPLAEAALLGCAVLTGFGAVTNAAGVRPGESVVVFGLGGVGLAAVQAARIAGASEIIAVDPAPAKEALARQVGATQVLRPAPDLAKQIRASTGGRGADHAIECVGRAETIRTAWSSTRRGGRTVVLGLGTTTDTLTFNSLEVTYFARTLSGCMYGSTDPAVDLPVLVEHYRAGRLDLGALVTDRIALSDVDRAMDQMAAGAGARSVVVFDPA
jgi:S-(hydroxymethyl)glutathione dehydrogenase/alcohol dehydrogenase